MFKVCQDYTGYFLRFSGRLFSLEISCTVHRQQLITGSSKCARMMRWRMKNFLPGFVQISPSLERSCGVISAPPGRFILPLSGGYCSTRYIINHLQSHFGRQYPLLNSGFSPCYYSKPSEEWRSEGLKL